ncbi:hypothetical protein S245_019374 [Arachis hypogaea]
MLDQDLNQRSHRVGILSIFCFSDWFPYDLSPEKTIAFMIVGENPTALVVGVSYVRRRVFALNLPHYLSRIQGKTGQQF